MGGLYGRGKNISILEPRQVLTAANAPTLLHPGAAASCGIFDGNLRCKGHFHSNVGMGDGNPYAQGDFVTATGLTGTVTDAATGEVHACAVAGGRGYCWGRNSYRNLDDESGPANSFTPSFIADFE